LWSISDASECDADRVLGKWCQHDEGLQEIPDTTLETAVVLQSATEQHSRLVVQVGTYRNGIILQYIPPSST
jgi:hypothetical protein